MLNVYLYSVTSISLTVFYVACLVFARGAFLFIFGAESGQEAVRIFAGGLGFAAVAFPIWWIHWGWLRKQFERAEGDSVLGHRFYLFSVVCLNAIAMLFAGGVGISSLAKYLFGAGNTSPSAMAGTGMLVFSLLLSFVLWRHHWLQFSVGLGVDFPFGKKDNGGSKEDKG